MNLDDLLAMEVPSKQLKHLCSIYKIKPNGNSLGDYAKAIASHNEAYKDGEILAEEFRYAGKTAVRIYKPIDSISDKFNDINYFENFLIEKYGNEILKTGLRLPPNEEPQLFKVAKYNKKLFLSFIYLGSERRIFRNYQIVKERPQNVDYLVLHFNPLLLEMRVPLNKDNLFKKAFLKVINMDEEIDWINMSMLSDTEANNLKDILGSELTRAKHKMTEGIYDSIEVSAKPDIDLAEEPDYQENYSDKPYSKLTFNFPFRYNNGVEDDISIVITKDGIIFRSMVSEEVIDHVIKQVLEIKTRTFKKAIDFTSKVVSK